MLHLVFGGKKLFCKGCCDKCYHNSDYLWQYLKWTWALKELLTGSHNLTHHLAFLSISNTSYLILTHTHYDGGATWNSASCPKILWNPGSGMAGHLPPVVGWGKEAGQRHNEQYKRSWSSKLPPLTDGAPNPCGPSCAPTTHRFWAVPCWALWVPIGP